jgi:hypothetical protein
VRSLDWSKIPLGPMDSWPQSLRLAIGICLNSRFPMFVWWGPELVNIYNDSYAPMLGARHPAALGRPARDIWGDIWPVAERGGRLPAVALTAYARAEDRVKAIRAGFQMHIAKPVEPAELIAIVASLARGNSTFPGGPQ